MTDCCLHGEATGGAKRERHESLVGRRILGGGYPRVQVAGGDNAPASHCGWYNRILSLSSYWQGVAPHFKIAVM